MHAPPVEIFLKINVNGAGRRQSENKNVDSTCFLQPESWNLICVMPDSDSKRSRNDSADLSEGSSRCSGHVCMIVLQSCVVY